MTLADLLAYDRATGEIRWRSRRANQPAGGIAGHVGLNGYRTICVEYQVYYAHHLAFLLSGHGFPRKGSHVDHINGMRDDNRLSNLRVVAPRINGLNRARANKNNTSGCSGVWQTPSGKFLAYIGVDYGRRRIGLFSSFEEAKRAREVVLAGSLMSSSTFPA
jgi:hypothetical protein